MLRSLPFSVVVFERGGVLVIPWWRRLLPIVLEPRQCEFDEVHRLLSCGGFGEERADEMRLGDVVRNVGGGLCISKVGLGGD